MTAGRRFCGCVGQARTSLASTCRALLWAAFLRESSHFISNRIAPDIQIDLLRGGNLAAVIAQRASLASPRITLALQILTVPATNLTYTASDKSQWTPSMIEHQNVFALRALDMFWCIDHYVPKIEDRASPDASPLLQNDKKAYEGLPLALILVTELDVMKSEGEMYAEKLKAHGVPVMLKEYKGKRIVNY
jgi:acetyl esterase/lipase